MYYTIHVHTMDGFVPIFKGEDDRIQEFMRFWKQFRPYSTIEVRYLNTMEGVTVAYHGEAKDYEKT